jgi:hypothetical protein
MSIRFACRSSFRGPLWVIRVAPAGSKASPNVRYAFNGDRICASQRTDAMCQNRSSRSAQLLIGSAIKLEWLAGEAGDTI